MEANETPSASQYRPRLLSGPVANACPFRRITRLSRKTLQPAQDELFWYDLLGKHNHCVSTKRMVGWALVIAWIMLAESPTALASEKTCFGAFLQAGSAGPCSSLNEHASAPIDDIRRLNPIEMDIRAARYIAVEPILRDYLRQFPSSWRAHYDLGYVLFRMHRGGKLSLVDAIKESIKELSQSLVLNVNNSDAHKILALDLVMIQREDLAEAEFKEAEHLNPDSAEVHYLLGRYYMGRSNYIPAKKELEVAIKLDSAYMKAYENLGITMDMMGNRAAALTNYLKAIDLDEKQGVPSELPYLDLSKFYHNQNELDLAQVFANKALQRNPRSDQAYFELARNYRERAEWSKAVEALETAIGINPFEKQYYFLLGQTYSRLGKRQESRKAFANYIKYRDLLSRVSESSGSQ